METDIFQSCWNETETYAALQRYVDLDVGGLHSEAVALLASGWVPAQPGFYTNDMADPESASDALMLLMHLGYLT